jgi:hypothetical protein
MNIFNFTKKLLPRIERHTVLEDLRTTEKECVNVAIPTWTAAGEHFKMLGLKSDRLEDMSFNFYRNFNLNKASKGVNFVQDISRRLENFHANVVFLQSVVDKYLEKDIIADGLTIRSAFVLRSGSNMSFVSRYVLNLLNYIYTVEAEALDVKLDQALSISPAEMRYVEKNFIRFVKLFSDYSIDPKAYKVRIGEKPDVFLAQNNAQAVSGFFAGSTIDSLDQVGLAGFVGNPIYRIRLVVAKWQNDRYESAKAKKQQLELRLTYLKSHEDNTEDPSIGREIERLQSRIEGFDKYLREVEESIAEE